MSYSLLNTLRELIQTDPNTAMGKGMPLARRNERYDYARKAVAAIAAASAECPTPYGDGKHFREVPGGHILVTGPGGVGVYCNDERQAAEVWDAINKAYIHAFEVAQK